MEENLKNYHKERIMSLQKEMIFRDYLAMDRTVLANQRTLLAYIRTFIGMIASGTAIVKLFAEIYFMILGWLLIFASPIFLAVGIHQYKIFQRKYNNHLYQ